MVLPPKSPLRMSKAIAKFVERAADGDRAVRTAEDQAALVKKLVAHVSQEQPHLGADPWVHDIDTNHVSAFLDAQKVRPGRRIADADKPPRLSASTMKKKMLDLRSFFSYVRKELRACSISPLEDLDDRFSDVSRAASRSKQSYLPFTNGQLETIFNPESYLAFNRGPDYFWGPLLGAHLGLRLGECVRARLSDIAKDQNDIWYLQVSEDVAKNDNSVRRIPITEPLIRLGFLEYVEHVRRLGATQLFPHRDLSTPTAQRKPSKRQTDAFGKYLTERGIVSGSFVFHSFRHMVVSALLDAQTPLHISMQLVGHEAQDKAIERELISKSAVRSVHLSRYAHPGEQRLGTENVLLPMKQALERSLKLPLDYERLKLAADIVKVHTVKKGKRFVAGWSPLRRSYTDEQLLKLQPLVRDQELAS
jgi:integrase